jgi:EmrB/QacA subfamily drug resistance transporter
LTTVANPAQAPSTVGRRAPAWMVLALTCAGHFMVILDAAIVNVALPSIRSGLGFTATGLQWVVNSYLLVFGGFLLLGGRTADVFGQRRMLVAGLAMFSAASLVCGLAADPAVLVAARAAQGLGAAVLTPATLTVVTTHFTGAKVRASALSLWTAAGGLGGVAGSVVGGAITGALSWRWIFLINVPIGAVLIVLALIALAGRSGRRGVSLDLPGAITATAGMASLIYGIVQTEPYGWGSPQVLVPLSAGVVLLAVFGLIEGKLARGPMLPLRLLRSRSVSVGTILLILIGTTTIASWYFASLFFQNVLGYGPMRAGLALTPAALALPIAATFAPRLLSLLGVRPLVLLGCVCHLIGFGWLTQATPTSTYLADLLGPTMIVAIGFGLLYTPTTVAVTANVTPNDAGIVSGLANASRNIGGSIGLAVLATVATTRTQSIDTPTALAAGYDRVFLIAAAVAILSALIATLLPAKSGC